MNFQKHIGRLEMHFHFFLKWDSKVVVTGGIAKTNEKYSNLWVQRYLVKSYNGKIYKTYSQGMRKLASNVLLIFVSKRKYLDKRILVILCCVVECEEKLLYVSPRFVTINCSFLKQWFQIKLSSSQHIQYFLGFTMIVYGFNNGRRRITAFNVVEIICFHSSNRLHDRWVSCYFQFILPINFDTTRQPLASFYR